MVGPHAIAVCLDGWIVAGNMPSGANSSCPATAWEGVSCDAATGRVSVIELTGRHLCDPVPCALPQQLFFKLSGLEAFKIPGVNIAASFLGPSALNLNGSRRLRVLDLSNNTGVRGPLGPPWPLLADGSLEYLNLSHCNLTGELPDNFPRNLRKLVLSHNSLQGPLPNFTSTGSDVELLDLSFNNLSGTLPNWSGRLGSLTASPVQILLQSNQLTGPLPEVCILYVCARCRIMVNIQRPLRTATRAADMLDWGYLQCWLLYTACHALLLEQETALAIHSLICSGPLSGSSRCWMCPTTA